MMWELVVLLPPDCFVTLGHIPRSSLSRRRGEQEKTGLHYGAHIYPEVEGRWKAATSFHCRHCRGGGLLFPVVLASFRGSSRFIPRRVWSVHTHRELPHAGERHGGTEVRQRGNKDEQVLELVFCVRRQRQ